MEEGRTATGPGSAGGGPPTERRAQSRGQSWTPPTSARATGGSRLRRALALVLFAATVGCGSSSPPSSGGSRGGRLAARGPAAPAAAWGGVAPEAPAVRPAPRGPAAPRVGVARQAPLAQPETPAQPAASGGGSQPIGAPCVNSGMCSQADGPAVSLQILTCVLDSQCPTSGGFVSCATQPCARSGWVC